MMTAVEFGRLHNSCPAAMRWRKALPEGATQADAWLACQRGDWLIWQLQQLPDELLAPLLPALWRAVGRIVDWAVRAHALHCGVAAVEVWAARWLSGEDRTAPSAADAAARATKARATKARAAAAAARAAAEASRAEAWAAERAAAEASRAAWAARAVVVAAARVAAEAAAEAAAIQIQASEIRSEIPEWPGGES